MQELAQGEQLSHIDLVTRLEVPDVDVEDAIKHLFARGRIRQRRTWYWEKAPEPPSSLEARCIAAKVRRRLRAAAKTTGRLRFHVVVVGGARYCERDVSMHLAGDNPWSELETAEAILSRSGYRVTRHPDKKRPDGWKCLVDVPASAMEAK